MHPTDVPHAEHDTASAPPAAAAPVEVELKFAIVPEAAHRLAALPEVKAAASGRAVTRRMRSVYYDTPDQALRARRVGLRLRREGGRWIQSLKSAGTVEGGLHRRDEHETPVPAQLLDFGALAQLGLADLITDPVQRVQLQPLFTCEFTRTARRLVFEAGTEIELCYDRGAIGAGERTEPLSEIELELKSGEPQRLIDFALLLLDRVPLRLEARSKAQRGYALLDARAAAPVKATAPALQDTLSVTAALRDIVFGCVAQLQANEAGVLAGADPEYLHQARVALRRLRSAFSLFRRAFPRAAYEDVLLELRWLGRQLGPARDWDVFVLEMLPRVARAFGDDAGMQSLTLRAAALRAAAGGQAIEAIASRRCTALLLGLNALFLRQPWLALDDEAAAALRALPLREYVAGVLSRRQRKVMKLGRHHAQLDAAGLHGLRIEIKKLRYAAEFFATLFERKPVRAHTAALADLQELLGTLNDAATVERLCTALREGVGASGNAAEPQLLEAIGAVRGWAAATARDHLEQLPPAWKRFRGAETFW
jgi:inorganic triphosphatase YgiF